MGELLPRRERAGLTAASAAGVDVTILCGGASPEHEVSLESGRSVAAALAAVAAERRPASVELVELDPEPAPARLRERLARDPRRRDVLFLALHGGAGEDGRMQALAEQLGWAHTGPGSAAAARAMDKQVTRLLAASRGLSIGLGAVVEPESYARDAAPWLRRLGLLDEGQGLVVKPRCAGSSVGLKILPPDAVDEGSIASAVEACIATGEEPLVEARQVGVELSVAVDCRRGGPPEAWTPVEIVPAAGRTFDYEQKYSEAGAAELCPPERLTPEQQASAKFAAERACAAVGLDAGIARVDFIQPETPGAAPVLLEVNALPGLTDRSLVRLAGQERGAAFSDLCLALVVDALGR